MKFTPTPEQRHAVACMISVGTAQDTIARALGISEISLRRHFDHEIKNGLADVHAAIGKSITAMALAGDKTMMIFYAKTRMGWHEVDKHSLTVEDIIRIAAMARAEAARRGIDFAAALEHTRSGLPPH